MCALRPQLLMPGMGFLFLRPAAAPDCWDSPLALPEIPVAHWDFLLSHGE